MTPVEGVRVGMSNKMLSVIIMVASVLVYVLRPKVVTDDAFYHEMLPGAGVLTQQVTPTSPNDLTVINSSVRVCSSSQHYHCGARVSYSSLCIVCFHVGNNECLELV